jgi:hypothetical protein
MSKSIVTHLRPGVLRGRLSQLFPEATAVDALGNPLTPLDYVDALGRAWRAFGFVANGELVVTSGGGFEYLVVAGGGAGGNSSSASSTPAGGGGAGGLITGAITLSPNAFPILVGSGGFAECITTAMICSKPSAEAHKWLSNPFRRLVLSWRAFRVGWLSRGNDYAQQQAEILEAYIQAHTKGPKVAVKNSSNSDAPLWESVLVSLMMDVGVSEEEAELMPANKALLWYYIAAESKGLCEIIDVDKHTADADALDAALRAKFEALNG